MLVGGSGDDTCLPARTPAVGIPVLATACPALVVPAYPVSEIIPGT